MHWFFCKIIQYCFTTVIWHCTLYRCKHNIHPAPPNSIICHIFRKKLWRINEDGPVLCCPILFTCFYWKQKKRTHVKLNGSLKMLLFMLLVLSSINIHMYQLYSFILHIQIMRSGATGRALDLQCTGRGFKSYSRQKLHNNLGQVVHTYVPLSPSSITWYQPRGSDAVRPGR